MCCLVVFLVACLLKTTTGVATRPCMRGWAQQDRNCYHLSDKHIFFNDGPTHYLSERFCYDQGAYLAEISSKRENDFIKAWLERKMRRKNDTVGVWIGAKKPYNKDGWLWVTSRNALNFTDWDDVQDFQSGKCASMSPTANYSWVREDCGRTKNMQYICERAICRLAGRCFNGSCYSLNCGTYRARSSSREIYDLNIEERYKPCPGGHLAQIETKTESDFITSYLQDADATVDSVWTGGYEETWDIWTWSNKSKTISAFTNWAPNPHSDKDEIYSGDVCIGLSRSDGWKWKQFECSTLKPVLCEKPDRGFLG